VSRKGYSRRPIRVSSLKLSDLKGRWLPRFKKRLSKNVLELKLSNRSLNWLGSILGAEVSSVRFRFKHDLEAEWEHFSEAKWTKRSSVHPSGEDFDWILYKAVEYGLRPLDIPSNTRKKPKSGLTWDEELPMVSIPITFFKIADQIIRKTKYKLIRDTHVTKDEKDLLSFFGVEEIGDIFEVMQDEYIDACLNGVERYTLISRWLEKNHPDLYEFYLHGKVKDGEEGSVFPSIAERLRSLDRLVRSKSNGRAVIQIAISQLSVLLGNDLLFKSIFYDYFYKKERDVIPVQKKGALREVIPYIHHLKYFESKSIRVRNFYLRSIYDLGVVLLNALAGEELYSEDAISEKEADDHKYRGRGFRLRGSTALYAELEETRKRWDSPSIIWQ
jgi:hypothetical protein